MNRREFFMVLLAAGLTQVNRQLARLEGEQEEAQTSAAVQRCALSEVANVIENQERRLDKLVWDVAWIRERVRGGGVGPLPFANPNDKRRTM